MVESDHLIGNLPLDWNWLADEYEYKEDVKNIHYTEGGPYFTEYQNCNYSKDWKEYYKEATEINLK